jgi:hypothetical protein
MGGRQRPASQSRFVPQVPAWHWPLQPSSAPQALPAQSATQQVPWWHLPPLPQGVSSGAKDHEFGRDGSHTAQGFPGLGVPAGWQAASMAHQVAWAA